MKNQEIFLFLSIEKNINQNKFIIKNSTRPFNTLVNYLYNLTNGKMWGERQRP